MMLKAIKTGDLKGVVKLLKVNNIRNVGWIKYFDSEKIPIKGKSIMPSIGSPEHSYKTK
jgi:hypothetical protein